MFHAPLCCAPSVTSGHHVSRRRLGRAVRRDVQVVGQVSHDAVIYKSITVPKCVCVCIDDPVAPYGATCRIVLFRALMHCVFPVAMRSRATSRHAARHACASTTTTTCALGPAEWIVCLLSSVAPQGATSPILMFDEVTLVAPYGATCACVALPDVSALHAHATPTPGRRRLELGAV